MFRYIELNANNVVISVIETTSEIKDNSYQESKVGEVGQKFVDGKFVNVPAVPIQPIETTDQKIARLEKQLTEQNIVQMEVLATIFEEIVGGA